MQLVKRFGIAEQRAAEHIAMAVDVFGERVQHDIGTMLDGSLQCRGSEGAVDGDLHAARMGTFRDRGDVENGAQRIDRGLEIDEPGSLRDCGIEIGGFG